MGLTGKERQWIQLTFQLHKLFCDCRDPAAHLTRCLMDYTDEEAMAAAALEAFGIDDDGGPEGTDTGHGDTEDPATAG
ncbi:ORF2 [torque teno Delphinidae virus 45]